MESKTKNLNKKQVNKAVLRTIIIISIISALIVIVLNIYYNSLGVNRGNARIVHDVKQVQVAIGLFYDEAGYYPKFVQSGGKISLGDIVYMAIVPQYHHPGSIPFARKRCSENFEYKYTSLDNSQSYKLEYCLEINPGNIKAGVHAATPEGIANP